MIDIGTADLVAWTLTDHLNTVRDIAKYDPQTGTTTVVNHLVYDAFGRVTSESNPAVDSLFLFTARPFDADTGLQNNLHRWYDPAVGRWLSEDPISYRGEDFNLYRYVGNNPTNATDLDGLQADSVSQAIKRCLELPFPANVKCLDDLLGSGYRDKEIRILQCELVYNAYKAAGAKCRRCVASMPRAELIANASCFSAEVALRAQYLARDCDCVLPGSVAMDSAKAKKRHEQQLAQKSAAAANCWLLASRARK
ncbi:RHS repeat domain-containing protein [Thermopirellula anaerolimosa]